MIKRIMTKEESRDIIFNLINMAIRNCDETRKGFGKDQSISSQVIVESLKQYEIKLDDIITFYEKAYETLPNEVELYPPIKIE